jgi:hypothetical protein
MQVNVQNMEHIKMNNTCGKTIYRGMMGRGFTVNATV